MLQYATLNRVRLHSFTDVLQYAMEAVDVRVHGPPDLRPHALVVAGLSQARGTSSSAPE